MAVEQIASICRAHGLSFGVAESCTGGLLGAWITSLAGISDCFVGGVISYANHVKEDVLGVQRTDLQRMGAVSAEVAQAMAVGVCQRLNCSVGVSITGIAGPGGGSPLKPVGTVYVGVVVHPNPPQVRRYAFDATLSRHAIREAAATAAVQFLAETLEKEI